VINTCIHKSILTYRVHLVRINEVIQRFCCSNGERSSSCLLPAPQIFLRPPDNKHFLPLLSHVHTEAANIVAEDRARCAMHLSRRIAIELQSCRK